MGIILLVEDIVAAHGIHDALQHFRRFVGYAARDHHTTTLAMHAQLIIELAHTAAVSVAVFR